MNGFSIENHEFNAELFESLQTNHFAKDLWPIVYILSDQNLREAYVGETTDTFARMSTHLKNSSKKRLTTVHLIGSPKFNKSATLDIESNLIKYMSGDGHFKLINSNLGLANHNYYQKPEVYWSLFKSIWDGLRSEGIAQHSLSHIDNSDLFKYSPYKSLREDQISAMISMLRSLVSDESEVMIMEGGAGTGKSILATFIFKLLATEAEDFSFKSFGDQELEMLELVKEVKVKFKKPKMALVVPMSSFRGTVQQIFKNIKGLKANMVISPAAVSREKFDILLVDEAHRLRKRKSLGAYIGAFNKAAERLGLNADETNELEWMTLQSKKTILFYDENQSIKPSDVDKREFDLLKRRRSTKMQNLKSQFRVQGGNDYVEFIDGLLNCTLEQNTPQFNSRSYELALYESVGEMVEEIKKRDSECGLSRTVAGFSWPWISNKEGSEHLNDIQIGEIELKWNAVTEDWINSKNASNEVGCIHTTQGYDLNFTGIIFGNEITYNKELGKIIILKEHYKDPTGRQTNSIDELRAYIINIYKTMMLRGIRGTYVYACDKGLQEYLAKYIPIISARHKPVVKTFRVQDVRPFKDAIPIYHLDAAAGQFSERQIVEEMDWIKIPYGVQINDDFFACRVVGESMNKIIPNGSYVLFRKYHGGTRNGRIVLVEYSDLQDPDFGSCYTVKEYSSIKQGNADNWHHESIVLKARSTDNSYEDIVIHGDQTSQFQVIGVFERVIS